MATYQDGHTWRKTLTVYRIRPNLTEVHPIAHKTSYQEYFKCKQIELMICLYACHDLLYTKVIVYFRWDYVT